MHDIAWPCELPTALKTELLDIAIPVGSITQHINNVRLSKSPKGIIYLASGIICSSFNVEGTNSMNATIFGPTSWLGASQLKLPININANIDELERTECILFPRDKIESISERNPLTYKWLYYSSSKSNICWIKSQHASLFDKYTRVAFCLSEISTQLPTIVGCNKTIKLSQKSLSNITGISRPRLNEVLKMLEEKGLISLNRESVTILNEPRLKQELHDVEPILAIE
ncbi:hypothetical protein DA097_15215 [Vibrio rotiferianus]|nr:hypothetical protein DA097_15215 [Vibrio rotiferianus]